MTSWDPDELAALRSVFLEEGREHLDAILDLLGAIEHGRGDRLTEVELRRKVHTLKGSAGVIGLGVLSQEAHFLEDTLVGVGVRDLPAIKKIVQRISLELERIEAELIDRRLGLEPGREDEPQPRKRSEESVVRALAELNAQRISDRRLSDRRREESRDILRVEAERIDELMDAASELVIDRTRIRRRLDELGGILLDLEKLRVAQKSAHDLDRELASSIASLRSSLGGADADYETLTATARTLQEGLRRIRRVTVDRVFHRVVRPIEELAAQDGLRVRIISSGEETEIDRSLVEPVSEPLLHLLRNAVAHGIEPPDERRRAHKSESGTIWISAQHKDDAIEISVRDDGRGIDVEAVRQALVKSGQLTLSESVELDQDALFRYLFQPGLSTRGIPDQLAGRGVGLDVVLSAIERLGGSVRISSTPGRGATFTLHLPLATTIQEALLFKIGGQVYAVAAERVKESVEITQDDIGYDVGPSGSRRDFIRVSGDLIPLLRAGALLGIPTPPLHRDRRWALVLEAEGERFAMTCDKIIGPREIVLRPLPPLLRGLGLYSGATISGAGKVQLIFSADALCRWAVRGIRGERPTPAKGPPRVLVVDDSRASREALSYIVAQAGYLTETATDGHEAWELLQERSFDLLITDLEMPKMDGFELIARVRAASQLELPILVVTARTGDEARARAIAAGATSVIGKPLEPGDLQNLINAALSGRVRKTD